MTPGSGWSPRRVLTLIRQLPPESRTIADLRGGDNFRGWGLDQYFYAALIDAVRENTYALVSAHSKRKPKTPEPVQRPDNQNRKPTQQFAAMAGSRIAAVRNAREGS